MAKRNHFDFIEAANHGYQICWDNLGVLLRLSWLPILIKIGCVAAILFLGIEKDVIKHGLVMLPSYFAEGFFIAYVIRMVHAKQDISTDVRHARLYSEDVIASMILYVLIKLMLAMLLGLVFMNLTPEMLENPEAEPPPQLVVSAAMAGVFLIWAFRFLWLYVPVAMGISLRAFSARIASFMITLNMFGCWFICFMPLVIVTMFVSKGLWAMMSQISAGGGLATLVVSSFQGSVEIFISLLTALAMAHGFKVLMEQK